MKKTYVAAIAILAASVIVLAAAVALLQYQPSQSGSGKLAVMGTDPPVTSDGVSDTTMTYSSVYAHQSGYDMASGWTQVSGSGTLDLMASQGTAQTMAASQVNAASYDAFKFNVDSCRVVYQGQTYTATVASATLTAKSQNQVRVNSSSSAAAVVDLRTFIVNTAGSSSPHFVFSASAAAMAVPPQTEGSLSLQVGSVFDLSAQAWWSTFVAQTSTNLVVDASLSSSSMVLHMQDSGSDAQVQEIIVTPVSATAYATGSLPSSLSGSAIFTVTGSGSLEQSSALQASSMLSGGATVVSGASGTLTYNGTIVTNSSISGSVVPGEQYVITCIGSNTYASTTVVAS